MACNIPSTYSQILATPTPKKLETPQVTSHQPNPNSFTALTGQLFRPPESRDDHNCQKFLITSSQYHGALAVKNGDANEVSVQGHCVSDKTTEKDPVFAEMIMIIFIFIIIGDEGVVSSPG